MSQMSISGAVSGLDTASIINQLVSVQANQQTLLKSKQSTVQKTSDAYASLITSLGKLSTAATDVSRTSAWKGTTATSNSTSVTVSTTSNLTSSLTFDVTSLAEAHALISAEPVASLSTTVASGPLTLTRNGTDSTIEVGTGSLSDVVAAINASDSGLVATAVQTGPGAYRLQVSSATTGAASSFTLAGLDGFTGMNVLAQGADATVHVGTDPATAYDATSSTNTFSSLLPGISFTVGKLENGVTVRSTVDGGAVADKVSAMVDAANSVLSYIRQQTAWNATTKTGGALLGESAVRALQQNILGTVGGAGAPGVHLTRDGQLTFNRTEFLDDYKADPSAVARAFGYRSTFQAGDGVSGTRVEVSSATGTARAGTYQVHVEVPPAREQWTVDPGGSIAGKTLVLERGAAVLTYTAGGLDTLDDAVNAINQLSLEEGFGVSAALDNGIIVLTAASAGSAPAFIPTLDGVEGTQITVGSDIAGTIDGQDATGLGGVLSLATGTGGAVGLSLDISTTDADLAASGGDLGLISYTPGLAQSLSSLSAAATNSRTGSLTTAQESTQTEIKTIQDQIDSWNDRLTAYRKTLTLQFTAMETMLAQLKSSMSAITNLTSTLNAGGGSSSSSGSSS